MELVNEEKVNMGQILSMIRELRKANIELNNRVTALENEIQRSKKTTEEKTPNQKTCAFFERGWRRGTMENIKVPKSFSDCEKAYGAVLALGKFVFKKPLKVNPHSRPAIQAAIDHVMQYPENHNFCISSRRCYVKKTDGTWSTKDEISRKRFFEKLREKIWDKFVPLVLESLSRQETPKKILDFAATHLKEHMLRWSNEAIERAFEKHRPLLQAAWKRRSKKPKESKV